MGLFSLKAQEESIIKKLLNFRDVKEKKKRYKHIINIVYTGNDANYKKIIDNYSISQDVNFTVLESGYDLISLLSQCRESDTVYPDLIFICFSLPDTNGLDLLNTIKQKFLYLPSPVIMVNQNGTEEIAKESIRNGAIDYFVKDEKYIQKVTTFIQRFVQNKRIIDSHNTYLVSFKISPSTGPLILSSESEIIFTEDELIKMGILYSAIVRQSIDKKTNKYRQGLFGPVPVPQAPDYQAIIYSTHLPNPDSKIQKSFCIFCLIYPAKDKSFFDNKTILEIYFKNFTIKLPRIRSINSDKAMKFKLRLLHALENAHMTFSKQTQIELDLLLFFKEIERLASNTNERNYTEALREITKEEIQNLKAMKDEILTKSKYV